MAIKRVIIMRGVPGSGKSSYVAKFARQLDEQAPVPLNVVSADHFFEKCDCMRANAYYDGKLLFSSHNDQLCSKPKTYRFNVNELGQAHLQCQNRFLFHLDSEDSGFIFVDNTNLTVKELSFYAEECIKRQIEFKIVNVICDLDKAIERNVHNVPPDRIRKMHKKMTNAKIPVDWPQENYYS